MDEDDIEESNMSTLDILKAQRARKAAAKKAEEESETESESQSMNGFENPGPTSENPLPASENPPPASENPLPTSDNPPPPSNQISWDFADEAAVPPGLRRKDVTKNNHQANTIQHNRPIHSDNTWLSTPPLAVPSTSAANHQHQTPSSAPLQVHSSQALQRPRPRQIQSSQKPRMSPQAVGKSRRRSAKS